MLNPSDPNNPFRTVVPIEGSTNNILLVTQFDPAALALTKISPRGDRKAKTTSWTAAPPALVLN